MNKRNWNAQKWFEGMQMNTCRVLHTGCETWRLYSIAPEVAVPPLTVEWALELAVHAVARAHPPWHTHCGAHTVAVCVCAHTHTQARAHTHTTHTHTTHTHTHTHTHGSESTRARPAWHIQGAMPQADRAARDRASPFRVKPHQISMQASHCPGPPPNCRCASATAALADVRATASESHAWRRHAGGPPARLRVSHMTSVAARPGAEAGPGPGRSIRIRRRRRGRGAGWA